MHKLLRLQCRQNIVRQVARAYDASRSKMMLNHCKNFLKSCSYLDICNNLKSRCKFGPFQRVGVRKSRSQDHWHTECLFSGTWKNCQGSMFWSENDIYSPSPPFWKWYFFPPLATPIVAFLPQFCPILHLFYPFTSPFLIFFPLSSFFFPLSSFFFHVFRLFFLVFSHFPPKMTSTDIPPPPGGGSIFQYIDPWKLQRCSLVNYIGIDLWKLIKIIRICIILNYYVDFLKAQIISFLIILNPDPDTDQALFGTGIGLYSSSGPDP